MAAQFQDPQGTDRELQAIAALGRATTASLVQGVGVLVSPVVQAELQNLVNELASSADSPLRLSVHIVNSPLVNAYAAPGGDIIVFIGLLDQVKSRDELAFVLSHEIAHHLLNHGLERRRYFIEEQKQIVLIHGFLSNMVGAAAATAVGGVMAETYSGVLGPLFDKLVIGPTASIAARLAGKIPDALLTQVLADALGRYSRAQESEADALGLEILRASGYDVDAALTAIGRISWHAEQ